MPALIAGILVLAVLYVALNVVKGADPKWLARIIKIGGGVVALAFAAFVGIRGEFAIAIPLGIFGAGLLGWSPPRGWFSSIASGRRSGGQKSQVRSEFIEMALDHDSGALAGRVIAGPHAGRLLDDFSLDELVEMARGFDAESWTLLESYLDRRFPAWRQHAQGAAAGRGGQEGRASSRGKMTAEEAYQILGLQPGATDADIGRAHRTLMKKLHPDQGGSTYLAAKINDARDTLIRTHHG